MGTAEKGKVSYSVYLIGIILFGLFYETIKQALVNDLLFVGLAILYLFSLSLIGKTIESKLNKKRSRN